MLIPFLIPKDYKLKHKILGILLSRITENRRYNAEEIALPISELARLLKVKPEEVQQVASTMQKDNVFAFRDKDGQPTLWAFGDNCYPYYQSRKYLWEGQNLRNERIFSMTKWVMPTALAAIAVYTTCSSTIERRRSIERIDRLQSRVDSIAGLPALQPQPKIYPDSISESTSDTTVPVPHR